LFLNIIVEFFYSGIHRTRQVSDYQIFQTLRQYLSWPKSSQITFCYHSYTWAVQLIRGVFHLGIYFCCPFRVIRVLFFVFWSLFVLYKKCWRTRTLDQGEDFITEEVNGVENKGSGDITAVDVEIFMGDFWSWNCFPQLLKYQNFWNISIWVKGILLQFIVAS